MTAIGTGTYRYDFQRDWAKLPRWWNFGEIAVRLGRHTPA